MNLFDWLNSPKGDSQGLLKEATAALEKQVAADDKNGQLWIDLAMSHYQMGLAAENRRDFEEAGEQMSRCFTILDNIFGDYPVTPNLMRLNPKAEAALAELRRRLAVMATKKRS